MPYVFDKFIPNGTYKYTMDMLVPPTMSMDAAKEGLSKSVRYYFENMNVKVDFSTRKIKTLKERAATRERDMFRYGGMTALLLFLLIPALNILSLGSTYTNSRAEEIALRKTFGASRLSSFLQIMTENFLPVAAGSVAGLLLSMPAITLIQRIITGGSVMENTPLVGQIDYAVVFAGVPPAVFLSGGLPAYLISKRNIAIVLKGGSK